MLRKEDFAPIGRLSRTHGVRGEVSARLEVDLAPLFDEDNAEVFLMLEDNGLLIPMRVEGWRTKLGDVDLIKFVGIDTPEQAAPWLGSTIWLDSALMGGEDSEPPSMERPSGFVGYELCDALDGRVVGQIIHVDETTINTLITIQTPAGAEHLLPLAEDLIEAMSVSDRRLTLHIPQGLLEDDGEYA